MALIFDYTAPNGASGNYFRILRIEGICAPNEPNPRWEVWIGLWSSQQIRAQNLDPVAQLRVNIPFSDLTVDPRQGAMPGFYATLKNYAPFAGQSIVDMVDDSNDIALDALKAMKIDEINSARLAANTSSFTYAGKQISCDTLSRGDIDGMNGYVMLFDGMPPNWSGQWKADDGSYVPVATVSDWKSLYAAMVSQGQANFAHSEALKQMVASATTSSQVSAITWATDTSAQTASTSPATTGTTSATS